MNVYNHLFDHRASKTKGRTWVGPAWGAGIGLTRGRTPQDANTPLLGAALLGHIAVVELLVAKGADKDSANKVREGRGWDVGHSNGV